MTDRELKKRYKKLGIVLVVILFLIIVLSVYTLCARKAEVSIYTNAEYTDNMQVLGIEEEEFKQYLSVFGNLMNEEFSSNLQTLNTAVIFIDEMCPTFEIQTNEAGKKCYDAEILNDIVKEIKGDIIKEKLDFEDNFTYNKDEKIYVQNENISEIAYCTKIENISKNGDEIEVEYNMAIMNEEQYEKYLVSQELEVDEYKAKAIIMKNADYKYSKYFVQSIEK